MKKIHKESQIVFADSTLFDVFLSMSSLEESKEDIWIPLNFWSLKAAMVNLVESLRSE